MGQRIKRDGLESVGFSECRCALFEKTLWFALQNGKWTRFSYVSLLIYDLPWSNRPCSGLFMDFCHRAFVPKFSLFPPDNHCRNPALSSPICHMTAVNCMTHRCTCRLVLVWVDFTIVPNFSFSPPDNHCRNPALSSPICRMTALNCTTHCCTCRLVLGRLWSAW